jgi:putative membrane protein
MMGPGWMTTMMMLAGALFGLGLLGLVIIGVLVGFRRLPKGSNGSPAGGPSDRALELLRERYARGEISRDEFQRMRQDLS